MGKNGSPAFPEKDTYKIGEVAARAEVEPYVLRYWETEFPTLQPTKSEHGQRLYRRQDVETVLTIKRLLYEEGFTIAGARKRLEGAATSDAPPENAAPRGPFQTARGEDASSLNCDSRLERAEPAPAAAPAVPATPNGDAARAQLAAVRAELAALLTLLSRR